MSATADRARILDVIEGEALARGVPADHLLRIAHLESGGRFDPQLSRGASGAKGLFQFAPATAAHYGIAGNEFDAEANAAAAARLYLDNRRVLELRHQRSGRPFLSGGAEPDALDLYVAHQQGVGGYRSLQDALEDGRFSRASTRSNVLDNVGARDIAALAGHDRDGLRALPDRELAAAYLGYWQRRLEQVRIPEKGIGPAPAADGPEPPVRAPALARAGITLEAPHALSLRHDDVRYGFGAKDPARGRVDCSGWVVVLQNAAMDEINAKAGRPVFAAGDRFSAGADSAATILDKARQRSGILLQGAEVAASALHAGMVIGEDNGPTRWDSGRFKGIDHVVMVVAEPASGRLMVSQSRSRHGVELNPLEDYLAARHARGVRLFASDPLLEARGLLQDQAPGAPVMPGRAEPAVAVAAAAASLLRRGGRGEAVRNLQEELRELGYAGRDGRPLAIDGIFGRETEHAVRACQRDHGLAVDGIAGPHTFAALAARDSPRAPVAERGVSGSPMPAGSGGPAIAAAAARLSGLASAGLEAATVAAWRHEVGLVRTGAPHEQGAAVQHGRMDAGPPGWQQAPHWTGTER